MFAWGLRLAVLLGVALGGTAATAGMGLPQRLSLLSERIESAPSDPALYLRRALILADLGEFQRAFADVERAARLGPVTDVGWVRSILLHRLGQLDQALPPLNDFLRAHPEHTAALRFRARLLSEAGEQAAALADYRRYLDLHPRPEPGDVLAVAQLMTVLADRGEAGLSIDDVLAFLDAQIAALGRAPTLQRHALAIEQDRCRAAPTLARLQALPEVARDAPHWHLAVAEQQLLLDRPEAAQAALDAAQARLSARRPTADTRAQRQRHAFLSDWLKLTAQTEADTAQREALVRRFTAASEPPDHRHSHAEANPHAHDDAGAGGHRHGALDALLQPAASTPGKALKDGGAIAAFYRCAALAVQ